MAGRIYEAGCAPEFPAYYKSLSRRLYTVLEDIGASSALRDIQVTCSTTSEILFTTSEITDYEMSVYICGSSYEGTTTVGLKSDYDALMLFEFLPVVTDIPEAQQYRRCLLLVQDSIVPAGYAKLQLVYNGVPQCHSLSREYHDSPLDVEGRVVLIIPNEVRLSPRLNAVLHGPASTTEATDDQRANDFVPAVRCRTWPACASEWLTRQRDHNWPTQDQLDKCRTLGCFLVQVGHPSSVERELQWRLSFTLQERMLVTDFNSVQLKCYVLLKMIKKEIIQKLLGEESLSSYHLKTCMLYMIETTPAELWTVDNLLLCLQRCLAKMLEYVERRDCPNYFIPDENMFEGRIFGPVQRMLCEVLRKILYADFKYLLRINCDGLKDRYERALISESSILTIPSSHDRRVTAYIFMYLKQLYTYRNLILERYQIKSAKDLFWLKLRLQRNERVTEHTNEQTRESLSMIIPYVDISLMSSLVVVAKRLSKSNEFIFNLLTSERWHAISLESDSFTARLKQACLLNVTRHYDMSLEILLELEHHVERKISGCQCSDTCNFASGDVLFVVETYSLKENVHRYWVPCVVFFPAERGLLPSALCYEMDRSVGSPPEEKKKWYDWAVVDGKILLYFLLYLNHRQLGMEADEAADTDNIWWLLRTDRLLGHRETAFNLLGWIYKDKGLYAQAVECFQMSLALQRTHNAASLLLQDLNSI